MTAAIILKGGSSLFKLLNNNRGVALLSVMVIMSVLVIVGSIMLTMASSESRMVYDYGNNIRAISLADSGADLVIKEWVGYIDSLDRDSDSDGDGEQPELLTEKADLGTFKNILANAKVDLVRDFRSNYNNQEVNINYTVYQPDAGELDYSTGTALHTLVIKIEGVYEDTTYDYEVKLWYDQNGNTGSHKGEGVPGEQPPADALPVITGTDPNNGAVGVPLDKTIVVTFSEPVQQGVNFSSIALKEQSGNKINATVSRNGNQLMIEPAADLTTGTTYTVTIPAGAVQDPAGNLLSSSKSFSFTTVLPAIPGPEDYVIYTNSLVFNNNARVTGNVLVGNGTNMVYIYNNSDLFGDVYVNTNLTVSNNACFGKSTQPVLLSVKGSVTFNNNVDIYGDLFYEGNLTVNNHLYVSGQKQQKIVNNTQVNLPALKTVQWYAGNSYTIVENDAWSGNLQDNGKYFFKTLYAFNNNTEVDNVIMACAGDITFHNNFKGSGIIFAPNGTVTFNNGCDFTGFIISKAVVFHNNITLTYKAYTSLPY